MIDTDERYIDNRQISIDDRDRYDGWWISPIDSISLEKPDNIQDNSFVCMCQLVSVSQPHEYNLISK